MKNIFVVTLIFACVVILVVSDFGMVGAKVYDCGMAEWHPDIPITVKEECRRLHYEEWQRQQQEKNTNYILSI